METKKPYETVDEYITSFPADIRNKLEELRAVIRKAAPQAQEKISYRMPTFYLNGNLVHFAAQKHHIGFYPGPGGVEAFLRETKAFKTSKGAVQFPMDKPMPIEIISRVVETRVRENLGKNGR